MQLSESKFLKTKKELALMTASVLQANLEGVVLKSPTGTYQPGKRNWLKVKKDYLFGGKMADTADLVVLGSWYGSGKKGGMLSIFLMGCYDARDRLWKTVTKVHSGLDDATNNEIHEELIKLTERADPNKIPDWLLCKKALIPDVLAKEPKKMPVWEITGAEFTHSEAHTAAGISIRFPRITRLRSDKSAENANDLEHLEQLYASSKQSVNVDLLLETETNDSEKQVKQEKNNIALLKRHKDVSAKETSPMKVPKLGTVPQLRLYDFFKPKEDRNIPKLECSTETETVNMKEGKSLRGLADKISQNKADEPNIMSETSYETTKVMYKLEENKLFNGLVAKFADEASMSAMIGEFVRHGGTLTKDVKKAALVFHNNSKEVDLKQFRYVKCAISLRI